MLWYWLVLLLSGCVNCNIFIFTLIVVKCFCVDLNLKCQDTKIERVCIYVCVSVLVYANELCTSRLIKLSVMSSISIEMLNRFFSLSFLSIANTFLEEMIKQSIHLSIWNIFNQPSQWLSNAFGLTKNMSFSYAFLSLILTESDKADIDS